MKKVLRGVIFLGLIAFGGLYWYYRETEVERIKYNQVLEIKRGVPLRRSLSSLHVADKLFFKIYLKLRDGGKGIKAGYYRLEGEYSIKELIQILEEGRDKVVRVTIPEGTHLNEILNQLEILGIGRADNLRDALEEVEFPYPTPGGNFEGYFYPETYFIPEGASEKRVVEIFLNEFLKNFPAAEYEDKEKFYQMLILASVIEREAQVWDEKRIISSVFHNRLARGMKLESDATVNYIYGYEKRRMYYKHLDIDSPYNTYRNTGLPPAPIANPDAASIKAAYKPEDTDYLFFVASEDGSGRHHFTKTYREHLNYIRDVRNKNRKKNSN